MKLTESIQGSFDRPTPPEVLDLPIAPHPFLESLYEPTSLNYRVGETYLINFDHVDVELRGTCTAFSMLVSEIRDPSYYDMWKRLVRALAVLPFNGGAMFLKTGVYVRANAHTAEIAVMKGAFELGRLPCR